MAIMSLQQDTPAAPSPKPTERPVRYQSIGRTNAISILQRGDSMNSTKRTVGVIGVQAALIATRMNQTVEPTQN